jgi:hypothetical protein
MDGLRIRLVIKRRNDAVMTIESNVAPRVDEAAIELEPNTPQPYRCSNDTDTMHLCPQCRNFVRSCGSGCVSGERRSDRGVQRGIDVVRRRPQKNIESARDTATATEILRSRCGDHKWSVGERRPTPDVVEAVQFGRERQADFVHNRDGIAFVNDSLEIVDRRPAGNRVVPRVREDAPHEFGNRGLLTEGNHGALSAEHVAARRKRGASSGNRDRSSRPSTVLSAMA